MDKSQLTRVTLRATGFYNRADESKKVCHLTRGTSLPIKRRDEENKGYVCFVRKNSWHEEVNANVFIEDENVTSVD